MHGTLPFLSLYLIMAWCLTEGKFTLPFLTLLYLYVFMIFSCELQNGFQDLCESGPYLCFGLFL